MLVTDAEGSTNVSAHCFPL